MMTVHFRRLAVLAAVICCLAGWGTPAHADWATCQRKPTRPCLLEEALRGDAGPLAGKNRLDVLVLAGAAVHTEYMTPADVDEAVRLAKPTAAEFRYATPAIRGLVAENRKQQATDLVASFHGAFQQLALVELARALAKANDLDTLAAAFDRMASILGPGDRYLLKGIRVVESVRAAAEADKPETALRIMMSVREDYPSLTDYQTADMEMAVAEAYAKRGDAKTAQRFFDTAKQRLEKAQRGVPPTGLEAYRFRLIALSALRGDAAAVRTALEQLPPVPSDRLAAGYRAQGYVSVVSSLLKAKQFPLALEVARSAPDSARDAALSLVNAADAAAGRIDDARAVLTLFSDKASPQRRAVAVRDVAIAMAKAGKLAGAVEMAAQMGDPTERKATLFAIAHALPQ